MRYCKKPVAVEAVRWFKNGDHPDDGKETFTDDDGTHLYGGKVVRRYRHPEHSGLSMCDQCGVKMHYHGWLDTLEGGQVVCPGDWIITVEGEMCLCKPRVFDAMYEPMEVDDNG